MKTYGTKILAIDPIDKILKEWCGPNIQAISEEMAKQYCQTHELGYCEIDGIIESEIPCDENYKPLWDKEIKYDDPQIN